MSLTFKAFKSSDGLAIRAWDTVAGAYVGLASINDGNDRQAIGLFGPTTSGTFTLTFGGQTTSAISFTATGPSAYALFQNIPVTPSLAHRLSLTCLSASGFFSDNVIVEVIEGGVVKATATFDEGAIGSGDFTLPNPVGASPCPFKIIFPAYVPTGSTISVRMSNASGASWAADGLEVLPSGGGSTVYDDSDGTHFSQSGHAFNDADGRFWNSTENRFNGGGTAGMAYSFDNAAVQTALQALSSIGAGNCTVSGNVVTFTGTMAGTAQATITSSNPAVSMNHTVGGLVPSFTQNGGGAIHCTRPFITWFSSAKDWAYYQTTADSLTQLNTDVFLVTVPDGWATTVSGALPGATVTALNCVGGSLLPAFVESAKTFNVGFNVENDGYTNLGLTFSDMTCRTTTFPLNANLSLNSDLYPTFIVAGGSQALVTTPTGDGPSDTAGIPNAPNGIYRFVCTDPGHAWITPGPLSGSGTSMTVVGSDTVVGDVKEMLRNFQGGGRRAPSIVYDWGASGAETTFEGVAALPVTTTNLKIYPPDPSDPTGLTAWTGTIPKFYPSILYKLRGAKSLRPVQALAAITNGYADLADIRTDTQLGRLDYTRRPNVGVVSCQQYTGSTLDDPGYLQILVTTSSPHGLFSRAWINLSGCGVANFSDGHSITIDPSQIGSAPSLFYGVITVLTDTTFVWHAGRSVSNTSGVTMTNTLTGGSVTGVFVGTPFALSDCTDLCNAVGSGLLFSFSVAATDATITSVATFIATHLTPGLKIRAEWGCECWNSAFPSFSAMRTANFQLFGIADSGTLEAYTYYQDHVHGIFDTVFAAHGRAGDVVHTFFSQSSSPDRTAAMMAYASAHGIRVDEVFVAPYFNAMPASDNGNPGLPIDVAVTLPPGVGLDLMELTIDTRYDAVGPHRAAIDAVSGYAGTPIGFYEFGPEGVAPGFAFNFNDGRWADIQAAQHAISRNWRFKGICQWDVQKVQDQGAVSGYVFNAEDAGGNAVYSTYEGYNQQDGTGDPAENPDPEAMDAVVSQKGAAYHHWISLTTSTPTINVSPPNATVVDGSTTAITPTTLNTTNPITVAILSGGGTISGGGSATSGSPNNFVAPSSGSGSTVIRFSVVADSIHADSTITYAPAPAPSLAISPTSGTVVDASTTLSITATLSHSTASLSASVSGGGTLSTPTPTSGTPFTYTPPTSGTGTATVTVTDTTDSLTRTCTVSYAPGGGGSHGYYFLAVAGGSFITLETAG